MLSEGSTQKLEFIIKVLYFAVIAGLVYVAYRFIGIVFPFVLAFALVAALQPAIRWMNKKLGVNRKLLSVILITIIYVGAGAILFWLVMQLIFTLRDALIIFPDYFHEYIEPLISNTGNSMDEWFTTIFPQWKEVFSGVQENLTSGLKNMVGTISQKGVSMLSSLLSGLPGFFLGLLLTIISSFFISTQYDKTVRFLANQIPEKMMASLSGVKSIVRNTIWQYMKALIILTAITFAEVIIGLFILGIPHPVGLAVTIAFFDFLPVFGPGAIMIPWVFIELLQGHLSLAIGIAVLYIIITILRRIIEPKVVGTQLGLNPILSLLSIYVGYRLLGFLGMIVFPIIVQIFLTMHKNGNIRLFKDQQKED